MAKINPKNVNKHVRVYFSSANVADYITVIFKDGSYLAMDDRPMHPQGFGQHGEGLDFHGENTHLGVK
jgi:hypothetical protein